MRRKKKNVLLTDRLVKNPADRATPPTAKQSKAPEMHTWSGDQLRAFLDWSSAHSGQHVAWLTLAMTGMRRGGNCSACGGATWP